MSFVKFCKHEFFRVIAGFEAYSVNFLKKKYDLRGLKYHALSVIIIVSGAVEINHLRKKLLQKKEANYDVR